MYEGFIPSETQKVMRCFWLYEAKLAPLSYQKLAFLANNDFILYINFISSARLEFLRDVISKNGQISPRLFRTQFLFAIKIKSTYRIVPPNT